MSLFRQVARIATLASVSLCLRFMFEVPLFPSAPYLKYDAGDIPVLIGAFALGPEVGVAVALVNSLVFLMLRFSPETLVGEPMNFLAGATFAWCAGNLYFPNKTKLRAVLSLMAGGIVSTLAMVAANKLALPFLTALFLPRAVQATWTEILTVILPFNLVKAGLNGVLVFLVYKRISPALKAANWEQPARPRKTAPAGLPAAR